MHAVVVGSGIAGLTAALHADDAGHRVTVVTKGVLGDGSTTYAQGGVAGIYRAADSAAQHADDTRIAGAGLSDPAAVEVLVSEGGARIAELIARGVGFDRAADGTLLLGREAAHTHARIVHAGGDATGAAIARALVAAVRASGITVVEHAVLQDLVVAGGVVRGVQLFCSDGAQTLDADAVILATGGAGHLYAHTTNPAGITGDGIAAALRAGAAVNDLEFVQFHPTVLAGGAPFLISEAVRGEGATLIDDTGRRFMRAVHPDAELAPRDVVARAIAGQAAAQGSPVRLDATMMGRRRLSERFPTIDRVTRQRGFDWASEPLPVTPAAHYLMGGIRTDLDGRSTIPGLFAVGETACTGVHGANRLASNSLLEGAVFGARAAAALTAPLRAPRHRRDRSPHPAPSPDTSGAAPIVGFTRTRLQQLMWDHVGLLRSDAGLRHALQTLRGWRAVALPPQTVDALENANLLLLAEATTTAALARTESVGAHHRHAEPVAAPVDSLVAPPIDSPAAAPVLETV